MKKPKIRKNKIHQETSKKNEKDKPSVMEIELDQEVDEDEYVIINHTDWEIVRKEEVDDVISNK